MDDETKDILTKINENFDVLRNEMPTTEKWHKHPLVNLIAGILITMLFGVITGYATIPSENKKAVDVNKNAIEAHKKDDMIKWNQVNAAFDVINNNFKSVHESIIDKPHFGDVKPIDNE